MTGASSLPPVVAAVTPVKGMKTVRQGSDMYRVLAALHELPGVPMTTQELADETGLVLKRCSGYAYYLCQMGLIQSRSTTGVRGQGRRYEYWAGERSDR
ncbi:hypothetical protein [Deinococcus multiflagellatus]|uniref:HTH iclR-type domain-containing protein n=1 Tax=Deinococcus multiflagellatus TaxID=1656887 RepID=A0ABW1ZT32_9DEIO|nr:hypothetical protein [Deinococcus multiflagellatus]MBZ9715345.1 hypothetical protein [Deinococcus multiflagellatus]